MPASPALDLGLFSKRTILTGAGWTRNWGGQLASEVWQSLMSHPAVQARTPLRHLLLDELSFEVALGRLGDTQFDEADRTAFERALLGVFVKMDAEIARPDHYLSINIYKVQEMLFQFCKRRRDQVDTGYFFTLNQDLWPERYLYDNHTAGAVAPALPGLQGRPNQRTFTSDLGPYSSEFEMEPIQNASSPLQLRRAYNVIKLHGSFNWRTPDGKASLVVGTQKTDQIRASPLLRSYWQVFEEVLRAGDVRLMVVGYGFGDQHVNAAIANAVVNYGLRLFIWDTVPTPELMRRIKVAPHGEAIWKGVLSAASSPLREVFPSNQAETEEYRRIVDTVFG
jgi:hypothetical protein